MRSLFISLLSVCAFYGSMEAQDHVTASVMVRPVYLGADGARFYNGAVLQPNLNASWKNGAFGNLWASTAANTEMQFDKEVDLTAGFNRTAGKLNYGSDLNYFFVQGIDVVNLNTEVGAHDVFLRVEAYAPTQKGGPRSGIISSAGVRKEFAVNSRISIGVQSWVKHDTGSFGFHEAWLAQGSLGINTSVAKGTLLHAGVKMSGPFKRVDIRTNEAVWEIGILQDLK